MSIEQRGVRTDAGIASRPRIVHAVGRWLARTETWLYNQVVHLPPDRVDVRVIATGRHPDTPESYVGVDVSVFADQRIRYRLRGFKDRLRRPDFAVNELLRSCIRSGDADLIHSHFGPTGWTTSRLARGADVRQVVTFYGYDVNWLPTQSPQWEERYLELFDAVDVVLCEGEAMATAIHRRGCPREKLRVHHLGIDVESIRFQPRAREAGEPLRLLMAARFFEKKGFPDGFRAIGQLRRETPVEVTVVGDDDGSPESLAEHAAIKDAVAEASLDDVVTFLGMRTASELSELAYAHHVFVSPSRTSRDGDTEGGAPVSIIEMAASGMPVVATTHCDIPEVLGATNRALLSPEGDVDALRTQFEQLLQMGDWTALVEENRRHVEAEYNVRVQSAKLVDLYVRLVTKHAP